MATTSEIVTYWREHSNASTHSAQCWKWHPACAILMLDRLHRGVPTSVEPLGEPVGSASMLYVGGSSESFKCPGPDGAGCGCNVFEKRVLGDREVYRCNACGQHYG